MNSTKEIPAFKHHRTQAGERHATVSLRALVRELRGDIG